MALASPQIKAVCVEANEFTYLSNQFRVRGVPHTVINRRASFVGALPEPDFVMAVLEGAGGPTPPPHPPPQGGRGVEGETNYSNPLRGPDHDHSPPQGP